MDKKITLATIKAFIRHNNGSLFIHYNNSFDGMTDCVQSSGHVGFKPVSKPEEGHNHANYLGIAGAWFVFNSRDYFTPFERDGFTGYNVSNSCGSFDLATRPAASPAQE